MEVEVEVEVEAQVTAAVAEEAESASTAVAAETAEIQGAVLAALEARDSADGEPEAGDSGTPEAADDVIDGDLAADESDVSDSVIDSDAASDSVSESEDSAASDLALDSTVAADSAAASDSVVDSAISADAEPDSPTAGDSTAAGDSSATSDSVADSDSAADSVEASDSASASEASVASDLALDSTDSAPALAADSVEAGDSAPATNPADVSAATAVLGLSESLELSDSDTSEAEPSDWSEFFRAPESQQPPQVTPQTTPQRTVAAPQPPRRPAPTAPAVPESGSLSVLGRVFLADVGIAFFALIALVVIEVQRMGEAGMSLRRQAYVEDLAVLFVVAVVFGFITFVLTRLGHAKVAIVQGLVTALVLGVAITSAATGYPKPVTVEQDQ
ncbi:hypothetical protein [Catenulispora yoronensis]|uniref:hypothetical protein n=1 Tax=Catenulispora yoronensis TaxID=450799 RepID=UPI0031E022A6